MVRELTLWVLQFREQPRQRKTEAHRHHIQVQEADVALVPSLAWCEPDVAHAAKLFFENFFGPSTTEC